MLGLFITGTDTGVGKTAFTCALAGELAARGGNPGVMKPMESGCARVDGELVPADARALVAAAGVSDPLSLVCPLRYAEPLAPGIAAERLGELPDLGEVDAAFRTLADRHRPVLVEGAGGLLVPVAGEATMSDLALRLELPLLVVARATLGTLNHTLLTLEVAEARGHQVLGVVLNDVVGEAGDVSREDNARVLSERTQVPIFGPIPHAPTGASEAARALAAEVVDSLNL